ncbi:MULTISPECIES: DUF2087 domain-containing protein [unclassified Bartonella]|uniref:DUF2087 domain-containing protein n=1 Tax=unclassified Bartonella TaxID=2645622 RepID=UPI0035D086CE
MTSPTLRAVYTVIILGAKILSDILKLVNSETKNIHKSINRLLNLSLIQNTTKGFQAIDKLWQALEDKNVLNMENFSDRHLETEDILTKIAEAFQIGKNYRETETSKICSLFTLDFARLRRTLVENGFLRRYASKYQRIR